MATRRLKTRRLKTRKHKRSKHNYRKTKKQYGKGLGWVKPRKNGGAPSQTLPPFFRRRSSSSSPLMRSSLNRRRRILSKRASRAAAKRQGEIMTQLVDNYPGPGPARGFTQEQNATAKYLQAATRTFLARNRELDNKLRV